MAQQQLPTTGQINWGETLNGWLNQLGPSAKGGLNYGDDTFELSLSLGADDEGYTFINTTTQQIKRWTGVVWEILLDGGAVPADLATETYVDNAIQSLYPVGSIYINAVNDTNPATLLGFGTWVAFGSGRVPVGYNASDADFDTAEKTGGEKSHTLTENEMPSHTHTQDPHNHDIKVDHDTTRVALGNIPWSSEETSPGNTGYTEPTTATNQNTGGGAAHNNLQPYITVYMWKRTA